MQKINFGLDAPNVTARLFLISIVAFAIFVLSYCIDIKLNLTENFIRVLSGLFFFCFLTTGLWMILSSKIFKYKNRDKIIRELNLTGAEHILDVGCGRGLYTIGFAEKLSTGKVYGIDIWNLEDISFNSENSTMSNVRKSGLEEKIVIKTEDMRTMSFNDNCFDIVVACFSIHNIKNRDERQKALHEIVRVTKKEGKIVIIDFKHINEYKDYFVKNNFEIYRETFVKGVFPLSKNLILNKR